MPTVLVVHEVDDVDRWLSSPKRDEFFGPAGISVRTFKDQKGSNRVGLILDVPDISALQEMLATDEAAAAMQNDGVRPETLVLLEEA
ncbi:MAG TPA: hypothetical protein VGO36_04470 [Solirubrobacterales bacterium]|jgi:hypothetical protein|nr:hypothetical protein [Solirubrobacterales bacterium]